MGRSPATVEFAPAAGLRRSFEYSRLSAVGSCSRSRAEFAPGSPVVLIMIPHLQPKAVGH